MLFKAGSSSTSCGVKNSRIYVTNSHVNGIPYTQLGTYPMKERVCAGGGGGRKQKGIGITVGSGGACHG